MVERSSQSLWKILTGHSAIQNSDLIISEVKINKSFLLNGIGYFKPPSSASESKLLSSKDVSGRKVKFIQEISKKLDLDQIQSLHIFKRFLLEGYCGSFQDLNARLTNSTDHQTLLVSVEDYYYKERLYILRCVKQILGYWQDGSHPFRVVYEKCVTVLQINTDTFVSGVWQQLRTCIDMKLPVTVETVEGERKWMHQLLLEQCELLEILLLFYKDFLFPLEKVVEKMKEFQSIGHELQGRYPMDTSSQLLSCHINHLYTLVLLEAFYMEWLLKNKNNPTELRKHRMNEFKDSKSLENLLQEDSSHHSLLLLAWSILSYMLTDDVEQIKYLEQMRRLDCQATFASLLKMLESPFLSGDRPVAVVCKSIINTLVSLVISLFSEESLGDLQVLLDISFHVLSHPRLRLEFWEDGLEDGLGVLLMSAMKRLPFDIDHVLKLLLSLSQDELSSQRVYLLLNECNHYTEECPDGVQQGTTVVLKHPRVLFEREYLSLGLSPLLMPSGTRGVTSCTDTMEEVGNDSPRTICWETVYSGWEFFAVQLIHLLHTPGIGLTSESHPVVDYVAMIIKLTTQVIKHDWSIAVNLKPILSNIYTVIHKFSGLLHPPVSLIAECIDCLAVMAENEAEEVWQHLAQTGFLPQLIGTAENLQVSPGQYSNILNVWERAHGCYAVTLATIRLLLSTLSSSDVITENMLATLVYIMQAVFVTSQNWRYNSQKDREEFCHLLLKLCLKILEKGVASDKNSLQIVLHDFTVDLLLTSSGHILIINVLGMGVNTVNKLTASSHNWCQTSIPIESLKLSFKVTDLLLQCKKSELVTPLEEALATRTIGHSFFSLSTPQHIITRLASYIYHHDNTDVPVAAVQLLTRLASVAPMSMFSCLGQEALALRDNFVNRLSARTENNSLRIAILGLISVSMGTQPGLLALFLSLKQHRPTDSTSQKKEMIGPDSCLYPVLTMIDPDKQVPPVVPSLLSAGVHLLRVLWEGRHIAALEAIRSSDKFWEHLMTTLYSNLPQDSVDQDSQQAHKLHICVEIFQIISMELYYVNVGDIDKDLTTSIGKFVSDGLYRRVCKVFQAKPQLEETELSHKREAIVSIEIIKAQYELAEVWKTFLLVALHHHESLFELHSNDKKELLLQELLASLTVQIERLPQSLPVVTQILILYLSLLKKWTCVSIPSKVIGRFIEILSAFINCEFHPNVWETLPLVYSCLICVVRSLAQNEVELEVRFTNGLIPLVVHTLTHYTQYLSLGIKHYPEVYGVCLLSELTASLLQDDSNDHDWLSLLQDYSVVMILVQACIGHSEALSHPEFVNTSFSFFLTLAMSHKGSRLLLGNNVFQLLNVSLCVVVDKLNPNGQISDVKSLKELMPSPQWLKVWLSALKLVSNLLCSQGHYVVDAVINFVGAHYDRLVWVLNIFVATHFMETLEEAECVCQFFQVLSEYHSQWKTVLLQQHNIIIERVLNLFNGVIAVLHRNRMKDIIKSMDSQGLLLPEESSTAIINKEHFSPKINDDSWIKFSPAYLRVRDRLLSIATSCLVVLNCYTPPLNDLFMCSFTQPLDLLEWPPLFHLLFDIPVVDPTCPPSISTLTGALSVGIELLRKSDPTGRSSIISAIPFRSPSKSSPIKSPITPAPPHRSYSTPAVQQKRTEILLMLELAVVLLMSQSVRYIIDSQVDIVQKQALKKVIVSELGNFCQVLLLNFHRKGAPSPRSGSTRTSLSSSRTTLHDSSSGRASSSHCFSDGLEQGLFKLAELFYKSKLLS